MLIKNIGLKLFRIIRGLFYKTYWIFNSKWPIHSINSTQNNNLSKKSLLVLYDFRSQPFSVGDILTINAASLVVSERESCKSIDFAMVFDNVQPVIKSLGNEYINNQNFFFHLSSILPAAQVNPKLGSLLLFDSHKKLEKYIFDNSNYYKIWPDISYYTSREYLFYHCMNDVFSSFDQIHNKVPKLSSRASLKQWANLFIKKHNPGKFKTFSIQLRLNHKNPARNSNYEAWENFFRNVAVSDNVIFFIICSYDEIPKNWSNLVNVIFVKNHFTSLEQDLAIIDSCDYHMGASSGPGMMAILGKKPYRLFSYDGDMNRLTCLKTIGDKQFFSFSDENQFLIRQSENAELILKNYKEMLKQ